MRRLWVLAVAGMVAAVIACSGPPATAAPSAAGNLTVYAAASLTASFRDLATAYQARTGTQVTLAFDSSATLEAQIEQGAPADLLASADTTNPQKLVDAGLAAGPPVAFAGNLLTIIVPGSGQPAVTSPRDLARPGVKVVAAADAVPITKYASQLIGKLARQPGYPADYAGSVANNIVSREDNVKGVVTKVELDEGDAGIVYATDAKASTEVRTVDVPTDANVPATYAAVAVKGSRNAAAAADFLAWLTGPDAQSILATYGFTPAH
jgi:molybdate transport system substrate-binding protein